MLFAEASCVNAGPHPQFPIGLKRKAICLKRQIDFSEFDYDTRTKKAPARWPGLSFFLPGLFNRDPGCGCGGRGGAKHSAQMRKRSRPTLVCCCTAGA